MNKCIYCNSDLFEDERAWFTCPISGCSKISIIYLDMISLEILALKFNYESGNIIIYDDVLMKFNFNKKLEYKINYSFDLSKMKECEAIALKLLKLKLLS